MSESSCTTPVVRYPGLRGYRNWIADDWHRRALSPFDFEDPQVLDEQSWRELVAYLVADTTDYRPPRRGIEPKSIVAHWCGSATYPDVHEGRPACFRCRTPRYAWHELDRAHLATRAYGGLDVPGNLVMLCLDCHVVMPRYWPEEYQRALWWTGAEGLPLRLWWS